MKAAHDPHWSKSNHAGLVQRRARKQAATRSVSRLLTRAVLHQRPNVAWLDLDLNHTLGSK